MPSERLEFRDRAMFKIGLSMAAKVVFYQLDWHARDQGFTFIQDNTLATKTGLGKTRIYEVLAELRSADIIDRALDEQDRRGWVMGWHSKFRKSGILIPEKRRGKFRKSGILDVRDLITESPSINLSIDARAETMKASIWGYMRQTSDIGRPKDFPEPDDAIVQRCLEAAGPEATEESIRSVLRAVWNRPDHRRGYPRGPRSYAWFPVILAQEFATSPERNPKRRSA